MLGKTAIGKYRVATWRERCVTHCTHWATRACWPSRATTVVGLLALLPVAWAYYLVA